MTSVSDTTNGLVSEMVGGNNGSNTVPVCSTEVLRCGRLELSGIAPSSFTPTNVRATKFAANQSVPTASEVQVVFDNEDYDPAGLFSSSTYTAAENVLLEVSASVLILQSLPSDGSEPYILRLKVDGSVVEEFREIQLLNNTGQLSITLFTRLNILAGQTVDLHFYHTTGVNQTLVASVGTYFELRAIQGSM